MRRGYWEKEENHVAYFKWLGEELGYHSLDGWYNVTVADICRHGGSRLLHAHYNGSPSKALQSVYPEHNWLPWRFSYNPNGFLDICENQRHFFEYLLQRYRIVSRIDFKMLKINEAKSIASDSGHNHMEICPQLSSKVHGPHIEEIECKADASLDAMLETGSHELDDKGFVKCS